MRTYSSFLSVIFIIAVLSSSCKHSKISVSATIDLKNGKAKVSGSTPSETKSSSKKKDKKRKKTDASKAAEKIIKTARGFTGTPYKFGGTSRAGLDCSGLTSVSYKSADIVIPRTSHEQSLIGATISFEDLMAGDLVFFSDHKGSRKITHVGIITEVGSKSIMFIHASTKLGVVENELFSGYYRPLFVTARRVL